MKLKKLISKLKEQDGLYICVHSFNKDNIDYANLELADYTENLILDKKIKNKKVHSIKFRYNIQFKDIEIIIHIKP
ncbi:MAG: hypothetical protein M0Q88_00270 [Bacilli bacterium]|nr:hypothetical protein [Bacilli bacterium]